jgi:N-methylhydantoinase A
MRASASGQRLAIDIGGTFTDLVLEDDRRQVALKVLTTSAAPEEGVLSGVQALLERGAARAEDIGLVIHGTTLATNAIIERKGARTALVSTRGFRDVLDIADEGRYDQYDIFLEKPKPLVPRRLRFTVPERINVEGVVLERLDESAVAGLIPALREAGVESLAVGFLHAYRNPAHERRAGEIIRALAPDLSITLSSEVCPEIREYERFSTACANAYVQPLMSTYLGRLREGMVSLGVCSPILLMTSGGGLTSLDAARRFPIRLVESGPAGGAILASAIARDAGLPKVLSFDMGGTTAKICLIEHGHAQSARSFEVDRAARFVKGSGLPLRIPVIEMVEIGAGGGSIARVDELMQIAVGPESAGADPGPACYDRGGERPTVTDADLGLGRIDPDDFAGGSMKLSVEEARRAIESRIATPLGLTPELAAFGISEMVDETMANAARVHAVERGKVVAEHTLVAFGGAAPLHASRLAEKLSIGRVLVPRNAGVGSAVGFLRAPIAYEVVRSRYMRLRDFDAVEITELFRELRREAAEVVESAAPGSEIVERRLAYMRYVGQGHEIAVDLPVRAFVAADAGVIKSAFDEAYAVQYERTIPSADIEVLTWALTLSTPPFGSCPAERVAARGAPRAIGDRSLFNPATQRYDSVHVYSRDDLGAECTLDGPCIITENDTATYVSETFQARVDGMGAILLERRPATKERR